MKRLVFLILMYTMLTLSLSATLDQTQSLASIAFPSDQLTTFPKDAMQHFKATLTHATSCKWTVTQGDSLVTNVKQYENTICFETKFKTGQVTFSCTTVDVDSGYSATSKDIVCTISDDYFFILTYSDVASSDKIYVKVDGVTTKYSKTIRYTNSRNTLSNLYILPRNDVDRSSRISVNNSTTLDYGSDTCQIKPFNLETTPMMRAKQHSTAYYRSPIEYYDFDFSNFKIEQSGCYFNTSKSNDYTTSNIAGHYAISKDEANHYHWLSTPLTIDSLRVFDDNYHELTNNYLDTLTNQGAWTLYTYDSNNRASKGPNHKDNWKLLHKGEYPGKTQGFILAVADSLTYPIHFFFHYSISKPTMFSRWTLATTLPITNDTVANANTMDNNWHLIGSPNINISGNNYMPNDYELQENINNIYILEPKRRLYSYKAYFIQADSTIRLLKNCATVVALPIESSVFSIKEDSTTFSIKLIRNNTYASGYEFSHDLLTFNNPTDTTFTSLYFKTGQKNLVVDALPDTQQSLYLNLNCKDGGQLTLHLDAPNRRYFSCILYDSLKGKQIDLVKEDYVFKGQVGHFDKRFKICFDQQLSVNNKILSSNYMLWTEGHTLHLKDAPLKSHLEIINAQGLILVQGTIKQTEATYWLSNSGVYFVQIDGQTNKIIVN